LIHDEQIAQDEQQSLNERQNRISGLLARRYKELHAVAKLAEERGNWDYFEKMTELLRPNSELYGKT
jgi:hypothetical protein